MNQKDPSAIFKSCVKTFACFFLLSLTLFTRVNAQLQSEKFSVSSSSGGDFIKSNYLPASATASGFAIYGQATVNKFTGTPSINVTLGDAGYKDLDVGINLTYQKGNGIKPSDFPGPVGNGWFLSLGGAITRISKGISSVSFPNPETVPVSLNMTDGSDWSSNAQMLDNIQQPKYPISAENSYDEFTISCGSFSGNFYKDNNGAMRFKSKQGEDLKIEMIREVASKTIVVPLEDQESAMPPGSPWTTSVYNKGLIELFDNPYSFVITDSKGVKYTFGGTDESIEFSRPGFSINNFPSGNKPVATSIEPVSWFLTSVKSPNGYEIKYTYERGKVYLSSNASCANTFTTFTRDLWPPVGSVNTGFPTAGLIKSTLINPTYLKKITTPEAEVELSWSVADQQLGYQFKPETAGITVASDPSWHPDPDYSDIYFNNYADIRFAKDIYKRFPSKLDVINISTNSGLLKKITFNYTQDITERLKLLSIKILGSDQDELKAQQYEFKYNNLKLPSYLSFGTDAYGFYNNNTFSLPLNDPTAFRSNFSNPTWYQAYIASRAVSEVYTQAEMLTKVIYPTGGYNIYEYENNRYGRVADSWPPSIIENQNQQEIITGGLRIKTITSYDIPNHVAGQQSYVYKKNYATGGQLSSGVLSYVPRFFDEFNGHIDASHKIAKLNNTSNSQLFSGNMHYVQYGTTPINPMNYTRSGFMTYSEVSEVGLDGRYVNAQFKNFDNGYHDKVALNAIYDHKQVGSLWKEDAENSMDLERGQVLNETIYDNTNAKKQQTTYEYNDEPTRFDDNGINHRIIKCYANPIMSPSYGISLRYIATLAYGYYPFLKQRTTEVYEPGQTVTTIVKYQYNNNRQLKEQINIDSKGEIVKSTMKYPMDYLGVTSNDALSAGITKLISLHNFATPVEQAIFKSGPTGTQDKLVSASFTKFKADVPLADVAYGIELTEPINNFTPSGVVNGVVVKDSRYQALGNADRYDEKGNVIQRTLTGFPSEVYLWGYNRSYPIASIKNATYTIVETVLGGEVLVKTFLNKVNPGAADVDAFLAILRSDTRLKDAQVTTYTYSPLIGMKSQTDVKGMTLYYEYDEFQRLRIVRNQNKEIIKTYCYNYAGNIIDCYASNERVIPPSTFKDYSYSESKLEICNLPSNLVSVRYIRGYKRIPVTGEELDEKVYTDEYLTMPAPTGLYVSQASVYNSPITYLFIEDGFEKYYNTCWQNDPIRFTYSSTYPLNSACSDLSLPSRYAFVNNNNQMVEVGTVLTMGMLTLESSDGYYIKDNMIYTVVNGIITEENACTLVVGPGGGGPGGTPGNNTMLAIEYRNIRDACQSTEVATYYHLEDAISIGTVLYKNAAMTRKASPGYYVDGSQIYIVVSNGEVWGSQSCNEVRDGIIVYHPPFEFSFDPLVSSFEAGYTSSRQTICGGVSTTATLFTDTGAFNEPVPLNALEHVYFTDEELNVLAPEGYYTLNETEPGHSGPKIYYLRNGRILFSVFCDEVDPPH